MEEITNDSLTIYEKYQDAASVIEDICNYKGVPVEDAEEIYMKMLRYESHGYKYDWTISDIDFDYFSRYYWSIYDEVYKIVGKLKKSKLLECAKVGVLTPYIEVLKDEYPYLYQKFITVNSLVREAYYAYVSNRGRFDLQCDREYAISEYKKLLNRIRIFLNNIDNCYQVDNEYVIDFNKDEDTLINNPGIIVKTRSDLEVLAKYSPLSFDKTFYMANSIVSDDFHFGVYREKSLNNAHEAVNNKIKFLESINSDECYRNELLELMQLSSMEIQEFDQNILQYKKEFRERYGK